MVEQKKYWVPALEKAHQVLALISVSPGKLKLIDLSKRLDINKSSMFSLLQTMEALQWVRKNEGDGYSIGSALADFGYSFLQGFDLAERFRDEAAGARDRLGHTVQLSRLEGPDIRYLGKVEAQGPFRLVSQPGMRMPAYATAMGKAMLAFQAEDYLRLHYPNEPLSKLTRHTIGTRKELGEHLEVVRKRGYALDLQEAVEGVNCLAAPVFDRSGQALHAVSVTVPVHRWDETADRAKEEIRDLAGRLSRLA